MSIRTLFLLVIALLGIDTQRDSNAALNSDPFAFDPDFYNGNALEDRFAAISTDRTFKAQKLVKLDNGDVVAAGLVPAGYQPDQANGYFNIGLVRYNASGGRVAWPNITAAYNYYNNMYIAYPNSTGSKYTNVRDIKAIAGFIHVLADYQYDAADSDVVILSFSENGQFVGLFSAFDTTLTESGAGLAVYAIPYCMGIHPCIKIITVATYVNGSGRAIITTKRFRMDTSGSPAYIPNGMLSVDNDYGLGGNGTVDFPAPDIACWQTMSPCSIWAKSVAATGTNTANPRIYVSAETLYVDQDRNPAVLAFNGADGSAVAEFDHHGGPGYGIPGFVLHRFDIGGNHDDETVGIAVSGTGGGDDKIYVLSKVAQNCRPGIGVLSLDGTGRLNLWGNFDLGKSVFGGSNAQSCPFDVNNTLPSAITVNGNRLAIAGTEGRFNPALGNLYDPLLAIVRASDGTVIESRSQRPSHAAGASYVSGGGWNDVIANDANRFITTGPLYDSLGSKPLFGTARFVADRIFGNGFENP